MINDIVPDYLFNLYFQNPDSKSDEKFTGLLNIQFIRGNRDTLIAHIHTPYSFESEFYPGTSVTQDQVFRAMDYESALRLQPDADCYLIYSNISNDLVREKHSITVPNVENFPHIRNLHMSFIVTYSTYRENPDTSYEHEVLYNVCATSCISGRDFNYSENGTINDSYNTISIKGENGNRLIIEENVYLYLKGNISTN